MNWVISCGHCKMQWPRKHGISDYERQAIESGPCPVCGSHTLHCAEPQKLPTRPRLQRDTERQPRIAA